jgi:hypothetical protein
MQACQQKDADESGTSLIVAAWDVAMPMTEGHLGQNTCQASNRFAELVAEYQYVHPSACCYKP